MSKASLTLKRLCFTGPDKADACIMFHAGLNIVWGASDSGKSFILESIDFMLGGGGPLRDIPERVGYDRIWLSIARSDGSVFTLTRSSDGGDFKLYEGLVTATPENDDAIILLEKHHPKKPSVSSYILGQIGLENKKIKEKADGTLSNFTLPSLRHLCIVSENTIQEPRSPILSSGQWIRAVSEMSAFKLLVTGVDDSALIKAASKVSTAQSEAKVEFIDELLFTYEERFKQLSDGLPDGEELAEQLQRLDTTIEQEQTELGLTESQYRGLSTQRTSLRNKLQLSEERREEISEMLQRFSLLQQHYSSDIDRLEGIREAGSLVSVLTHGPCPLCGAQSATPHPDSNCDANLDKVVIAADAEREKILRLRSELAETVKKMQAEFRGFEQIIPRTQQELNAIEKQITQFTPSVSEQRSAYRTLVDKRANVINLRALWEEIKSLKEKKSALEKVQATQVAETLSSSELSESVWDSFSELLKGVLQSWHFPGADRVHFDVKTKDFVINGKPRSSRGKGLRAITHAAFTVSLLEFCKQEFKAHLGFVVMDSPLLAYKKPDEADDGVSTTGLNEHFFSYLSNWTDRQAIIIENVDPPAKFAVEEYSIHFSGNLAIGRAGFFPPKTDPVPAKSTTQSSEEAAKEESEAEPPK